MLHKGDNVKSKSVLPFENAEPEAENFCTA